MLQRKQLLQERIHASYKSARKLAGPAACPDCGAVYRRGRWRWEPAPRFLAQHRDEILARARNCEAAEKSTHSMQRIVPACSG